MHSLHWQLLIHVNVHCLGDPDGSGNRPITNVPIPAEGAIVHVTGYGFITVVTMTTPDCDSDGWAISGLAMRAAQWAEDARYRWRSEAYHRGSTQFYGIECA